MSLYTTCSKNNDLIEDIILNICMRFVYHQLYNFQVTSVTVFFKKIYLSQNIILVNCPVIYVANIQAEAFH